MESLRDCELAAKEVIDVRDFFPEGCFFHWDGKGKVPIGTQMLFDTHNSIKDVCTGCRIDDCEVRIRES